MVVLIDYRKAHFEYEILEKYEAGIELLGFEVKSLKGKHGSLDGAYVLVKGGEAWIQNMLIPPYQEKNTPKDYEPRRHRRLIMKKKEIAQIADVAKGLTVVPISMYTKNNLIKVTVAIVKGKKKYDKRETTKKREADREMGRVMRDR
ncbi:MAG TPA: SsrA-binding protein SmpB [Candidatus Paceibacterota bacterium]|jgi:SsrA-binding protein|nr:SsrA-binding protein SmpB [Candidatus Paceibacterota bacterium]